MTAKDVIKQTMELLRPVATGYLSDMTDTDLFVRPVPQANHIAWQLGHVISGEHQMVTSLGHQMPNLPQGFAEAYTSETATSDDRAKFATKNEYLALMDKMRAATVAALQATPEADFEKPAPESMRSYAPTVGAAWIIIAMHELMHAGQWAVVRRKLGKPVLI
jgi:hypothetical protein